MTVVFRPRIKVREADGWRDMSTGDLGEDAEDPGPNGWLTAFNTRNLTTIDAWYVANTGHDTSLEGDHLSFTSSMDIDAAWLSANEDGDHVTYDEETERWTVERFTCTSTITAAASNVTIREFHMDSQGALYCLRGDEDLTGIVFEHGTVSGNGARDDGGAINFNSYYNAGQVAFRFLDISGVRAGLQIRGGTVAEYCYVHDLHYSDGSHNASMSIRARNTRAYRNRLTDGNSSALSLYAEYSPFTNVVVEENIFSTPIANYEINFPSKDYSTPAPGDTRVCTNNLFERGDVNGAHRFTTFTGNTDLNGDPV